MTRVGQALQLVVLGGLTADASETETIVRAGAKRLEETVKAASCEIYSTLSNLAQNDS